MTNILLTIFVTLFHVLRITVRWTIRLALLGMLISMILASNGCTTTGSDYHSPRSTAAVHEALRDFSMHAVQQQPTCEWYPSTLAMVCN